MNWVKCLRSNGLNAPDPVIGSDGSVSMTYQPGSDSGAVYDKATKACGATPPHAN